MPFIVWFLVHLSFFLNSTSFLIHTDDEICA
jgi:hypothetical protein